MGTGKKDVQILMSTYNGEKYLSQQLDSFLAMEHFDRCRVLIRDDGSTDDTREILNRYASREDFQIVTGENLGVIGSYQWLLKNSDPECEYFAFSDQDDVWLPDKLSKAFARFENCPSEKGLLFASCSQVTDSDLHPIGKTTEPIRGLGFYNAMVQNVLPGHTQIFNRTLRDLLVKDGFEQAEAVDWWVYLLASGLGTVQFEPTCTVLHRQHTGNAVGYQMSPWREFYRRVGYIRQKKGNAISRQLLAFYALYKNSLPLPYAQELAQYLIGLQGFRTRLKYIRSCRVYRQNKRDDWKFRLLYLFGKYDLPHTEERLP